MTLQEWFNKAIGEEVDLEKIIDAAEAGEPSLKPVLESLRGKIQAGLDPAAVLALVKAGLPEVLDIAHGVIHPADHPGDGM